MTSGREEFLEIFHSIDFEKIVDHPNILIAAAFWDEDRYQAAKTCYRLMRYIDDLIDNYKSSKGTIAPDERAGFIATVENWLELSSDQSESSRVKKEVAEVINRFRIPLWPLKDFAEAMLYDINNDGFPTLESFMEYSKGASVAPASIFVHLNGLTSKGGEYEAPCFNVGKAARPCAVFSYLVHIIRDFQKDQLNNLDYFADDIIAANNLTRDDLHEIALGRPVCRNFRNLVSEYYILAGEYRSQTLDMINSIKGHHSSRYQLSLEIIYNLYLMVYERINPGYGVFTTEELNPSPAEIKQRVLETIMNFKIQK